MPSTFITGDDFIKMSITLILEILVSYLWNTVCSVFVMLTFSPNPDIHFSASIILCCRMLIDSALSDPIP